MRCGEAYQGQFDPSNDLVYEVVKDVLNFASTIFPD